MAELNIDMDEQLAKGIVRLAQRHYGDATEVSQELVVSAALEMRLLSLDLVKEGANEVDEPLVSWEFPNGSAAEQSAEIRSLLFKRR